jgi:hypothetical protein
MQKRAPKRPLLHSDTANIQPIGEVHNIGTSSLLTTASRQTQTQQSEAGQSQGSRLGNTEEKGLAGIRLANEVPLVAARGRDAVTAADAATLPAGRLNPMYRSGRWPHPWGRRTASTTPRYPQDSG